MNNTITIVPVQQLAAAYVRMSTDRQSYSVEHQLAFIADFAETRGIKIVATYAVSLKWGSSKVGMLDTVCGD